MKNIDFIPRHYADLEAYLEPNKVLVIYGARQVGKTTLLRRYLAQCPYRYQLNSGDDISIQALMTQPTFKTIFDYVGNRQLIVLDEAQKIPDIGLALKIMVDEIPGLRILVTGSSSFELAGQVGEPLTGRKKTLTLYPIAQKELLTCQTPLTLKQHLSDYLIYGSYPQIISAQTPLEKQQLITEITHSYLLKDLFAFDKIKNSKTLLNLLRLLAFQIGSEVSHTELGKQLGIDSKTIARMLDILEKGFVLFNLRGFSKNLRKEITKKSKYYFYDTGIRNALIANFNPLPMRNDLGALWENFLMIERLKKTRYDALCANPFFWRTWDQKEIDLIEERGGALFGYEFKWGSRPSKAPHEWLETYTEASYEIINQDNYLAFIT